MRIEDRVDRFLLCRIDERAGVDDQHVGLLRIAVICMPCCSTLPSMISASTRFLAQPRLIMPTFVALPVARGGGRWVTADR